MTNILEVTVRIVFFFFFFPIQIVNNKSALAVYIKQSVLCLRKVNLHAYFTKPVLQVHVLGTAIIVHADL